ncbi:efflux RND transporter periplasmic adaptor subunit [Parvicella tangerina]|uniref:Cobalt-zinc-cadmium resistance protein CzcB n=1 Tax=Parvicella tangerina TaxID=2829795 RepID=A0A916JPM6_9FLAO|nr:efflux RND transporter periplasmic adaptor subunit [Parvicella tangerina]CAG5085996.1 Cobalt-zinc-cadmium resistance protein CzcB [Parvicella tangerina]
MLVSCASNESEGHDEHDHGHGHSEEEHGDEIHFSEDQFNALGIKVDTLPKRNLGTYVEANGELKVSPQNQAEVTAVIGANVKSIEVTEGEMVKKGQILAFLAHPDLIQLQTEYITNWNDLQFLEQEYERQSKLYEDKITSGKDFQQLKSDYNSKIGVVNGLEAQLQLIGISVSNLQENKVSQTVALRSPINGYIRLVEVKIGQYVNPETSMFEIIDNEHVHVDLFVFESDVHKVKEGQNLLFSVESVPDKTLTATIYSVGQSFEQNPKAVLIHAKIDNKEGHLIPGMYVKGRIIVEDYMSKALPEEAVVREEEKYYIFKAKKEADKWAFEPIEVAVGVKDGGWLEIKLFEPLLEGTLIAWNNAYNLMAELKKGEAEHSH